MMSAIIRQLGLRKRMVKADAESFAARRDQIVDEAKGDKGDKGETGPMPDHQWKGTKLRFQKQDGEWGKFVELKGKPGEDGKKVVVMGGGGNGFNPTTLGELPGGVLSSDFLLIERNGTAYRVPVSAISGGEEVALSKRIDFISESLFYRGEAAPGASDSASVWRIKRIEFSPDGDVTEKWAGGTADFDKTWDDRSTLNYI